MRAHKYIVQPFTINEVHSLNCGHFVHAMPVKLEMVRTINECSPSKSASPTPIMMIDMGKLAAFGK